MSTNTKLTVAEPVENLKEKNASHAFRISVRDREHFYKIVNWLNKEIGKGEDKWTMEGRILRKLRMGRPVDTKVYIFINNYDTELSLYLSLL